MNQVQLEQAVKKAAYQIHQVLEVFKDEDPNVRGMLEQSVFNHVQLLRHGERVQLEGEGLVAEVPEPADQPQPGPINTGETDQGEDSEAV